MRYWAFFVAKILVCGLTMYGLLLAMNWIWPQRMTMFHIPVQFGYDLPYTVAVGVWFLLCYGALCLCIVDQRYRCRVCLRRLRMPIETGSWSRMLLFGRPRIEYICPYGHGKLNVDELQIAGSQNPEWTPHAEMWEELYAQSDSSDHRK